MSDTGIVVADGVWRAWHEATRADDEPSISLVVRSPADPEAVLAALGEPEGRRPYSLALTPEGAAVYLEEPDDFAAVVVAVKADLERAGISGRLEPLPFVANPLPERGDLLMCRMRLSGEVFMPPRGAARWVATPQAMDAAARQMSDWCAADAPPGVWYAKVRDVAFSLVPDDRARWPTLAAHALQRSSGAVYGSVALAWATPSTFRSATLDGWRGALTLIAGGATLASGDWGSPLEALVSQLVAAREHVVYGFIRRAERPTAMPNAAWTLTTGWPPIRHFNAGPAEEYVLEWRKVPDAYGVQLVNAAHQPRPTPNAWRTQALGPGVDLVSSVDPSAWYAQPRPADDVIAEARREFGSLLIVQQELDAVMRDLRSRRSPPRG